MIKINGLSFCYHHRDVLQNVNLNILPGEIVAIIGPNGSGKSTLLRCMNRVLQPPKGTISIFGKGINEIRLRELSKLIGYVPQHESSSLSFTVYETVLMGRRPHIGWHVADRDLGVVDETLRHLQLEQHRDKRLDELSGGEKQRVLIARAMAQEPSVLLLDEPTSNLDPKHQLEVFELLSNLSRTQGISIVCAIHDLHLAGRFADKIVMLRQGRIIAQGPPQEVMTAESLEDVYGIEAFICHNGGNLHVVAQRAL